MHQRGWLSHFILHYCLPVLSKTLLFLSNESPVFFKMLQVLQKALPVFHEMGETGSGAGRAPKKKTPNVFEPDNEASNEHRHHAPRRTACRYWRGVQFIIFLKTAAKYSGWRKPARSAISTGFISVSMSRRQAVWILRS